jgi:hypothetical protein
MRDKRLSKTQLKQILYYHFLNMDAKGIIKKVNVHKVAEALNCSINTIINNNNRLIELGFIGCTYLSSKIFNIFLVGYSKYHLTKEQGGNGYIQMSKEVLTELLKVKNVNVLRFELRRLLKVDNDSFKVLSEATNTESTYSYNEIKRVMPKYTYKQVINNVCINRTNILQFIYYNNTNK